MREDIYLGHAAINMKRVALVVGTRPEAIKVLPVYRHLKGQRWVEPTLIATGQHRQLLSDVFSVFDCRPDVEHNVMEHDQTLVGLTRKLFDVLEQSFTNSLYDAVVVQGDTTTAMVAGITAFYHGIPLAHIEAGLRTWNITSPFPEEMNRRIVALGSRWHFAPTATAAASLRDERVREGIYEVGNTVVDAAMYVSELNTDRTRSLEERYGFLTEPKIRHVLVTAHRRENFGAGIRGICEAVLRIAEAYPSIRLLFPVHLNPRVRTSVERILAGKPNIFVVDPLTYDEVLFVLKRAFMVITDSGGIQEEAPVFGVPVLVARETTERPEGVTAGCSLLVGTDPESIFRSFCSVADDEHCYRVMSEAKNPYGDGRASARICAILERDL